MANGNLKQANAVERTGVLISDGVVDGIKQEATDLYDRPTTDVDDYICEAFASGHESGEERVSEMMDEGTAYPNPLHREQVGDSTLAASMHRLQCATDNFNAAARYLLAENPNVARINYGVDALKVVIGDNFPPLELQGVLLSPSSFISMAAPDTQEEGGQKR